MTYTIRVKVDESLLPLLNEALGYECGNSEDNKDSASVDEDYTDEENE